VAALLLGGELILPVGAGGTGVDHGLLQLVDVEGATETGLTVSDDRNEPVLHGGVTLDAGDLVGAQQSVVDAADNVGDGVCRVEGLVGVGVAGEVGVTCDLPTGQVDSLQAGADLLDSLVAGEGAQCVDVVVALCGNCIPEDLGAALCEGVLLDDVALELCNLLSGVVAGDSVPAWVGVPILL